jgi:hypothetical protein
MWSLKDVANYFGISTRLARQWIVKQGIVEFRLHRVGWRVVVEITTEEMMKLLDAKRPVFGAGSALDKVFEREHTMKTKASLAGVMARARKREQQA